MGIISEPEPVNLVIGMLSGIPDTFGTVETELEKRYGPIDIKSDLIQFTRTKYYQAEMGCNIMRKFIGFKELIDPVTLASIKIVSNELETRISSNNRYNLERVINIDPGYLCKSRIILASTKDFSHRIYLREGIYAEVTLMYSSKERSYKHLQWTFPDYRTDEYISFFNRVRNMYIKKF